jgi:hypothetical protein
VENVVQQNMIIVHVGQNVTLLTVRLIEQPPHCVIGDKVLVEVPGLLGTSGQEGFFVMGWNGDDSSQHLVQDVDQQASLLFASGV